jgi:hypothetical protein
MFKISQMAKVIMMALTVSAQIADNVKPPDTGKFFYADFPQHEWHGQHAITAKLRNRNK